VLPKAKSCRFRPMYPGAYTYALQSCVSAFSLLSSPSIRVSILVLLVNPVRFSADLERGKYKIWHLRKIDFVSCRCHHQFLYKLVVNMGNWQ
jgi:hypothetical protein